MMAGLALIVVYLIILGGVGFLVIFCAAMILIVLSPVILIVLAVYGPSLVEKLKKPARFAAEAVKDLVRHMLRPPDR